MQGKIGMEIWKYCSVIVCLVLLKFSGQCDCAIIEGPSNVTYLPGLTPLPIELTCNVTGNALWRVNDTNYLFTDLTNGAPPGHNRTGTNILVISPKNSTKYICWCLTNSETMSDPAYIIIAGVPAMVPDITVDDISINENNVTLTLSWGEPFNNFDPIVNYTVLCSGDVTCPLNFTTSDNTTRSYTITNLTTMTNYIFSVVATNSIGSGEAGVLSNTTPGIDQVNGVMLMCEPVDLTIQCNVTWDPVTQEDITGYQVNYNETMITVNISTTTLIFTAPSLPDGVFTSTVFVRVTAVKESGVGPASNPATAVIAAASVTNITTPVDFIDIIISKLYNITVTCAIHPDSTADECEVMAMRNGGVTIHGSATIINGIATVTVNGLECGVVYIIIARGIFNNGVVVGLRSFHGNTSQSCPVMVLSAEPDPDIDILIIVFTGIIAFVVGVGLGIGVPIIMCKRKRNTGLSSSKENVNPLSISSQTQEKGERGGDGVTVRFNNPVYCVNKNAGPAQLVLVLNKPSTTVIAVNVTSNKRSATGGGMDESYKVEFHAGQTKATFDVPISDADKLKANANFMLNIDTALLPRDVTCGSPGQATVTIVDDDNDKHGSDENNKKSTKKNTEAAQPPPGAKKKEGLNYAELDNLTGPDRFGSVEHVVSYAQAAETQH